MAAQTFAWKGRCIYLIITENKVQYLNWRTTYVSDINVQQILIMVSFLLQTLEEADHDVHPNDAMDGSFDISDRDVENVVPIVER